jgi:hypothetical protein
MKMFALTALVLLASPVYAFNLMGYVTLPISGVSAKAVTATNATVAEGTDELREFVAIKEEGTVADTNSKTCLQGFPQPFGCRTIATDHSVTEGCEYCGFGDGRGYIDGILNETKNWEGDCKTYSSSGGGGPR